MEGEKKSDSEFLSYNVMLNSGKKFLLYETKKINILTLVLSEIKFLNETKNCNFCGMSLSVFWISTFQLLVTVDMTILLSWDNVNITF